MRKIGDISNYKNSFEKFLFLYDLNSKEFIEINNESFYNEYVFKRKCIYCLYDTDEQTGRILPNCYEDISTRTKFFKHLEDLELNLNRYLICFANELSDFKYYDFIKKNEIINNLDNNCFNNSICDSTCNSIKDETNNSIKDEIISINQSEDESNKNSEDDLPFNIILNRSNNLNKNWLNYSNNTINNVNKIIKINLLDRTNKKRSIDELNIDDKQINKLTTNNKQLKDKLDLQSSSSSSTISLSLDKPLDILLESERTSSLNNSIDENCSSNLSENNLLQNNSSINNSNESTINQSTNESIEQLNDESIEFRTNQSTILNEPMEESNDESIDVSNYEESSDYLNSQSPINYLLQSPSISEQRVKSIKEYELEYELTGKFQNIELNDVIVKELILENNCIKNSKFLCHLNDL